eukprot:61065-Prymnesium_polylepis.1
MCAQVVSRVLERILMGDNSPSMLNVGAGATHGSVQVALVRVARGGRPGRVAAKPKAAVWRLWDTLLQAV